MKALNRLIADVEGSIERGSGASRAQALSKITDLFLLGADKLTEEQIALFDTVIERFAGASEVHARAQLAERLAASARAPRNLLRKLAHDDIAVARPVLTSSTGLDDQDLLAVAVAQGRDHMLAISERSHVPESVTDILVADGDADVHRAVARNPGARFSALSTASLITLARADEELQEVLGGRGDLSAEHMEELVTIAKESAKRRLAEALPAREDEAPSWLYGPVEKPAAAPAGGGNYDSALAGIRRLAETGLLAERNLAAFAEENRLEKTIAALSHMTELPLVYVERLFAERDNDTMLVIGRSQNWSWKTVRTLLQLRNPNLVGTPQLGRLEQTYKGLAASTAQKVMSFLKVREGSSQSAGTRPGPQSRVKVR
jgi:uncharacterized protein (DUF2336 family)